MSAELWLIVRALAVAYGVICAAALVLFVAAVAYEYARDARDSVRRRRRGGDLPEDVFRRLDRPERERAWRA